MDSGGTILEYQFPQKRQKMTFQIQILYQTTLTGERKKTRTSKFKEKKTGVKKQKENMNPVGLN